MLLSGTAQASATDDYLNGLKALDAGRQSDGLYLLEQAAVAGMPEAQFRLGELLPGQDGERWLRSAVRQGSVLAANSLAQRYYDDTRYRRAAQCWLLATTAWTSVTLLPSWFWLDLRSGVRRTSNASSSFV